MSESKPGGDARTNSGSALPLPFLLDSPSSSSSPDINTRQTFSFGDGGNQIMESNFEEFDLNAAGSSSLHSQQLHSQLSQRRLSQTQAKQQQPRPQPSVETVATNAATAKEEPIIIKANRPTRTRNYKLHQGKTVFFCGGRFLTSRALWAFCLSLFLLFLPCILFLIFTCPWLWYNISPAVPIVFSYLFLLTFASMLKTSWTDPGILPRNLDRKEMFANNNRDEGREGQDRYGYRYSSMSELSIPLPKEVTIKGEQVRLKYCETCYIYRPPRASHCKQCDNCVENEDHHCIWLNNCVGKRNYTTFFTFIVGSTILAIYVIAFSLAHVITTCLERPDKSFQSSLLETPISFFVAIFCFLMLFLVGSLTGYHCFLVMRGVTTHEQIRSNLAAMPFEKHPFDFGNPFSNMFHILCRPHNKSYIGRRKFAEEEYEIQPTHHNQQHQQAPTSSTTIPDDQISTLDTNAAATSNIPLQNRH